jgi:hypothetical protein
LYVHRHGLHIWQFIVKHSVRCLVFNATFNNISVISRRSVLLVEETEYPEKTTDQPQVNLMIIASVFVCSSAWITYLAIYCQTNVSNRNSWIKNSMLIFFSFHIHQPITTNIVGYSYIKRIFSTSQTSECTVTWRSLSA